ncbi:MAG: tRNA (N6-isopentenyl adenosine(37)-C2)-methylthiotransferase MiaB [Clostridia bacterium]|nr:tRNA (N6-isopentenyl adenosine(37)-C2)-methylthiotransferase MiaB [Clostridia bacterium]MBO4428403.1 tRNA (N6-isopentenyl adenosine(37)-C2)-methylthiotransferase MiaB [Clostridia bacterium]
MSSITLKSTDASRRGEFIKMIREKIARDVAAGKRRNACVVTYGCQQNEADSERIMGMLCDMGYTPVASEEDADIIVVNTCAVREHAEKRALSITGGYKHLKEKNPDLIIGVGGCMVSKSDMSDKIKYSYPYVDFVFGTAKLHALPEIIYTVMEKDRRVFAANGDDTTVAEGVPVRRESAYKAWVSIMYGCNNFCTYCIVPYVRGRERSRRPEDVVDEVRGLVESGYKEITLLGQNVNSYGKGLREECDFADLIEKICAIKGDYIVRFMSSHPKDASKKLIDVMAKEPHMAHQFHLPLQSGSDALLKKMNRHYDMAQYEELVRYMREKMPDIAISSDFIVGFPGETEEDFEATLDAVKKIRYDMLFTFIYSKRTGTPAATMEDQIPEDVKSKRFSRLLAVQEPIAEEINRTFVGKTVRVLCEGESKTNKDKLTGRTEGNKIVLFDGDASFEGKFVNVKITDSAAFALYGDIEKN